MNGLGISDKVLRRIIDYNPKAHQQRIDNTNDLCKLELMNHNVYYAENSYK